MLNILNRCKKLVPPVFKSSVLLEQTGVFRRVCSAPKASCHSPCLPRFFTANVSSCQRWYHVYTSHLDTKRSYSEKCCESSDSNRSDGVFQGETHETGSDSSPSK